MPLDNTKPAPNEAEYANFVPAGVRRAAERANAAAAEYAASMNPEPAGEAVQPDPVAEPVATTVVEPVAAPTTPVVDWEQRYRTLQGKYDREVPSLRNDISGLRSQIETLTAKLDAKPIAQIVPVTIPDDDVETFGDPLIAAARRWARAEISGELEELRGQLASVVSTATTVQQQSAQAQAEARHQSTMAQLDAHPEIGRTWRTINDDQAFIAWLNDVDPFTGGPRMALLHDAFGRGDASRTAKFFQAYIQEHTATQVPAVTPSIPAGADRPTLETFASPGRATGPAPSGAQPDKRIWTPVQITAFYRDKQKGAFRDREAEAQRIEKDIFDATAEGRIR